jgi:hypothetical protein
VVTIVGRENGPVSALNIVLARSTSVKTAGSAGRPPSRLAGASGIMRLPPRRARIPLPLMIVRGSRSSETPTFLNPFVPQQSQRVSESLSVQEVGRTLPIDSSIPQHCSIGRD